MSEREERLLEAVVYMVDRVLCRSDKDIVDSGAYGAAEHAMEALEERGLIEIESKVYWRGQWTSAGKDFRKTVRDKCRANRDLAETPTLTATEDHDVPNVADLHLNKGERQLLQVLLRMIDQFLPHPSAVFEVFAEYGFVDTDEDGHLEWTDNALRFWRAMWKEL